ncbi:MAG: hypothetical protein ABL909_10805 [Sphingopyxis sp.]
MDDSPPAGVKMGALSLLNPLIFPLIPARSRAPISALWHANTLFSAIARGGKEPTLRQIKLRWWVDQLAALRAGEGHPDPLLTSLAHDVLPHIPASTLSIFAESWMVEIDSVPGDSMVAGAHLFTMTGRVLGNSHPILADAGSAWGMVERSLQSSEVESWSAHQQRLNALPLRDLPRALASLIGMTRRIARADGRRSQRGEQWAILKIGILGR